MHCSGEHSYKTGNPRAPPEILMILLLTQVRTNLYLCDSWRPDDWGLLGPTIPFCEKGGERCGAGGVGGLYAQGGKLWHDGYVGELAVVCGSHGVEADKVE